MITARHEHEKRLREAVPARRRMERGVRDWGVPSVA